MSDNNVENIPHWQNAYNSFNQTDSFGDNRLAIFAIALQFGIDDFESTAQEAITDHSNDKGADVVFVDREQKIAVIAQCYWKSNPSPTTVGPTSKAHSLNQFSAWLNSSTKTETLPPALKRQRAELLDALQGGEIDRIHLWYVHNCRGSENTEGELRIAAETLRSLIDLNIGIKIDVHPKEVSSDTFSEWYEQVSRPILVSEEIVLKVPDYYETESKDFNSISTVVDGAWLKKLFDIHKEELFSANLRGYLGSKKSDSNINQGIKSTVNEAPGNFFIFNNGVTALTNQYTIGRKRNGFYTLTVNGLSIVNGAQTTGAISSALENNHDPQVKVAIRIIRAENQNIIDDVVRFNNSQNKIEAADFRSNDAIQRRLVKEFSSIPGVEYDGGRRGGAEDVMRRRKAIPAGAAAQAIAAFHGMAIEATRGYSHLWTEERLYRKVFDNAISANHLLFCYSLVKSIENYRWSLRSQEDSGSGSSTLTKSQRSASEFLNIKGAQYLIAQGVAQSFETLLDQPIDNSYRLGFKKQMDEASAISTWQPLVSALLKTPDHLLEGSEIVQRINLDTVKKVGVKIESFLGLAKSTGILDDFISTISTNAAR